jgi:methyltransferase (TIGR00027 family)
MAESRKAQVFEVHHPATSKRKARLIKAIMGELPRNVSLVQIDFNRETLERVLEQAGYQPRLPTVFIWEGVSNYLRAEVVDSTLAFCGKAAPGSVLIFTYIDQEVLSHTESFYGTKRIMKLLTGVGERWTYGMELGQVESHLERYGLQLQKDLAASDYRRLYYGEESAEMRGYEFYREATAAVKESTGPITNC